jgi:hypothetical protein
MLEQIKEQITEKINYNLLQLYAKYYFTVILIVLGCYLIYEYIIKKIFPNILTPKTINTIQDKSTSYNKLLHEPDDIKPTNEEDKIYYIYWTGGYDSTFRLCEMLIKEKKVVQPLYVSLALDNDCLNEETCNKLWFRRNRKYEKRAMKNIRVLLMKMFPYTKTSLLPTIYIDEDIDDSKFNYNFEKRFYNVNLWPNKRKKHQYYFLSKFSYYHKQEIDIGVLGIHDKSKFAKFLKINLKKEYQHVTINNEDITRINYYIPDVENFLYYIKFPIYNRTKEELYITAERWGYHNILKHTWSCWFPNKDTGKPCGKCPMCKERVVSHPEITTIN